MWCTNCKNEFRPGITVCPMCNIELSEELSEEPIDEFSEVALVAEEELKNKIIKYLEHLKIPFNIDTRESDDSDNTVLYAVSVPKKMAKETTREISVIVKVEAENKVLENPEKAIEEAQKEYEKIKENLDKKDYVKAKDKQSDYKQSGIMFICIGVLFVIFIILSVTGTIPFSLNSVALIVYSLIGAFGIIYGIVSVNRSKSFEEAIKSEEENENSITVWLNQNIFKDAVMKVSEEIESPELAYMAQSDYVKAELMRAFPDVHEDFADELVEEFLNKLL